MERAHPIQVLVARDVPTVVRRKTQVIAYRPLEHVVTENIVKSRKVTKEVPCTIMKPCTEIDPATGQACTVMKPVIEVRTIDEYEYYAEPVERKVVEMIPYLKEAFEDVPQVTSILEYKTQVITKEFPVVVPGGEVRPDRTLVAPQPPPPCDTPAK
jgi:hypothetical protein